MTSWTNTTGWDGAPEEYFETDLDRLERSLYSESTSPQDLTSNELNQLLNNSLDPSLKHDLKEEKNRRETVDDSLGASGAPSTSSTNNTDTSISKQEFHNQIYDPIQNVSKRVLGGTLDQSELGDIIEQLYYQYNTRKKKKLIRDLNSNDHDRQENALRVVGEKLGYI